MEMAKEQELILVLDFGSQYNQLITRRIREMGVYSELHDHEISIEEIKKMNPKGIILSGGPNSVYEEGSFTIDPEIYNLGIPVLGICYGMQLTTKLLGGKVERANEREYGKAIINAKSDELFAGLPAEQTVWMSHSDKVIEIPEGFEVIADSP
ncbi:glutamine-hydrolyzing GMP synthase, partial [Staphylococcus aureus]|nr:glutamine-hydrolyzing GMP synthase [Staphylococcus aureus]MVJ82579.1 glutamine-hydrolyzing GMP synthase [Staphylococcus aureus]